MLGQTIWAARSRRVIVARTESAQWMASGCSEETDTVCAPSIAGDTPLRLAMPTSAAKATEKELMPRKRGRLSTMVLKANGRDGWRATWAISPVAGDRTGGQGRRPPLNKWVSAVIGAGGATSHIPTQNVKS